MDPPGDIALPRASRLIRSEQRPRRLALAAVIGSLAVHIAGLIAMVGADAYRAHGRVSEFALAKADAPIELPAQEPRHESAPEEAPKEAPAPPPEPAPEPAPAHEEDEAPPPPPVATLALAPEPESLPAPVDRAATKPPDASDRPEAPSLAPPTTDRPAMADVSFAGIQATAASRVAYVLDCSGPMAPSFAFAVAELKRSVARLGTAQSFQVVVFGQGGSGGGTQARTFATPRTFVQADDAQRERLSAWLDGITLGGRSEPLVGLGEALESGPDLVFLLTRSIRRSGTSWGAGAQATLKELDRLNPQPVLGARRVVIKAVQFVEDDPTGLLKEIARVHGDGPGSYRVVPVRRE